MGGNYWKMYMSCKFHFISSYYYYGLPSFFTVKVIYDCKNCGETLSQLSSLFVPPNRSHFGHLVDTFPSGVFELLAPDPCVCCLCQKCNKLVFWFSALPAKLAPSLSPPHPTSSPTFFILYACAKTFIVCRVFKLHFLFIDSATNFASYQRKAGRDSLCEGIRHRLLKILAAWRVILAINTWDYDSGFVSGLAMSNSKAVFKWSENAAILNRRIDAGITHAACFGSLNLPSICLSEPQYTQTHWNCHSTSKKWFCVSVRMQRS